MKKMQLGFAAALLVVAGIGQLAWASTGVTVGAVKVASPRLASTWVKVHDNYLQLVPRTAAFEVGFQHNGLDRSFTVIRPEPAVAGSPVLLMLHGRNGNGEAQANLAGAAAAVAAQGFWAVLPLSRDNEWEDDPTTSLGYDDVGYIARILDIMSADFSTDPTRAYASGMSEGGFMTQRLACELSDRIAAFAMVGATITTRLANTCEPALPRPMLFMHGTSDPIVPWNGYLGVQSVDATLSLWSGLNGCAAAVAVQALPDTAADGTTISLIRHPACEGGTELRLYRVQNGGHTWPGGLQYLPASMIGLTSMDLKATTEIWNVVSPYRR